MGLVAAPTRDLEQMVRDFRLEDVNVSSAFFDVKKLRSFNGDYIRALSLDEFVAACEPWLDTTGFDADVFRAIAPEVQTRIEVLSDVTAMVDWLFAAPPIVDQAAMAAPMLDGCIAEFAGCA